MKRASLLLFLSLILGVSLAFAAGEPTVSGGASVSLASASASVASAPVAPAPAGSGAPVHASGMAPLPKDEKVPGKWLPPGSFDPDRGPSDVVFPAQNMTLRFNHKAHMAFGLKCAGCHNAAPGSEKASDDLIPGGRTCDQCHGTDHGDLAAVKPGAGGPGACSFCHVGHRSEDGNRVAPFKVPTPNLVFNHKKHVSKNINCQQCHGSVEELELATRDQLPRMRGCFGCHQMTDSAARGTAKSACDTCHIAATVTGTTQLLPERRGVATGGVIKTQFAQGQLKPPRWLHNAAHTPDFMERHKLVAANDSQFCANCHKEDFCTGCHDGRVRPRNLHPSDYVQMHPVEARQNSQKCTSCHREQSFCLSCHQRLGVSMSGPAAVREPGRFHPPKFIWSDAPRKPGHHSQEATRNLNACVSCHVERDCVTCHGGAGIGGGFNPHPANFASSCSTQFKRNPRPCVTCHDPASSSLAKCR